MPEDRKNPEDKKNMESSSTAHQVNGVSGEEIVMLKVTGMSCASCVSHVESALTSVEGVAGAEVNLAASEARVRVSGTLKEDLIRAVEQAGFQAGEPDERRTGDARSGKQIPNISRFRRKFWIALPIAAIIMVLDMGPMLISPWGGWVADRLLYWNLVQMLLASVVLFYAGSSFFLGAWKSVRRGTADMNTLVAMGTGAAFLFSVWATFLGREDGPVGPHDVYYETAAIIVALILLGRWMEERAREKSRDAMTGLMEMVPQTAHLLESEGSSRPVDVSSVRIGDRLLVKAWEQVPVDGFITNGIPVIDESMMTGESLPVEKEPGREVTGGTRNTGVAFEMQALRVGENTALARIIQMVREAQNTKPPIQRLVDKVASVFVPVVLIIAGLTFLAWWSAGSPTQALVNMVAVLVIACPCALGLATPTGLMVSAGRAAEKGFLIRDAVTLEEARKIDVVFFDKTGTLTTGKMMVQQVYAKGIDPGELTELAASVEQYSDHPLARSLVDHAQKAGLTMYEADDVESFMGLGIRGRVEGRAVSVRSYQPGREYPQGYKEFAEEAQDRGETVLLVTLEEQPAGFITLSDQLRDEASTVIEQLKAMGIATVMVTGDQPRNARVAARKLNIGEVEAGIAPDAKAELIKSYQKRGKRVAMVGDGVNDAAALVQADLGIALAEGTDLAASSSDITLIRGGLDKIVDVLALSRGTLRIIRQNLFWAFLYNSLGIPLAALGYLSPMFAALAMALSSVSVVSNSLRIRKL